MANTPTPQVPSRGAAAVAGVVTGGMAVGATELLAGILPGAP